MVIRESQCPLSSSKLLGVGLWIAWRAREVEFPKVFGAGQETASSVGKSNLKELLSNLVSMQSLARPEIHHFLVILASHTTFTIRQGVSPAWAARAEVVANCQHLDTVRIRIMGR